MKKPAKVEPMRLKKYRRRVDRNTNRLPKNSPKA
jgi:hypothetical protein